MTSGDYVIGYCRVSTELQGESGAGLEAQRQTIFDECERKGWSLLRYEEDVLSGKDTSRPGLDRALDACRSEEAAGIIVAKLDRLTRSVADFASLLTDAQLYGYNVVALDVGIDLRTPHGEFLANVLASIAQWERRIISQRTREALAVKRAQGVRIGRPRAITAEIEERIRAALADGEGYSDIAHSLNDEGVPTAGGGRRWHPSTIRRVALR